MKILLINGSRSEASNTRVVLNKVNEHFNDMGVFSRLINVIDFNLEMFNPDIERTLDLTEKFHILDESTILVIGSPEYHGSYTGILKNFLDHLNSSDLENKIVGIISTSGSPKCGINTLNGLRIILRNLHANVIIDQLTFCEEEVENLIVVDEKIEQFVNSLVTEFSLRCVNYSS